MLLRVLLRLRRLLSILRMFLTCRLIIVRFPILIRRTLHMIILSLRIGIILILLFIFLFQELLGSNSIAL